MTRVVGEHIVACPACSAEVARAAYASIHLTSREVWSDGTGSIQARMPDGVLGRCRCGEVFRPYGLSAIRYEPCFPVKRDPGGILHQLFPRRHEPRFAPSRVQRFDPVGDNELRQLLAAPCAVDVEIEARRRLWQLHNAPYRNDPHATRAHADADFTSNLERLALLLAERLPTRWSELGEIYRELGRFEDALQAFERVSGDRPELLIALAAQRDSRVALVHREDQPWREFYDNEM